MTGLRCSQTFLHNPASLFVCLSNVSSLTFHHTSMRNLVCFFFFQFARFSGVWVCLVPPSTSTMAIDFSVTILVQPTYSACCLWSICFRKTLSSSFATQATRKLKEAWLIKHSAFSLLLFFNRSLNLDKIRNWCSILLAPPADVNNMHTENQILLTHFLE